MHSLRGNSSNIYPTGSENPSSIVATLPDIMVLHVSRCLFGSYSGPAILSYMCLCKSWSGKRCDWIVAISNFRPCVYNVLAEDQSGKSKVVDNYLYVKDYKNDMRLRKTYEQVCSPGWHIQE
jgi:hypothetical protein